MLSYALVIILELFVATFGAPKMLKWFADSWDSTAVSCSTNFTCVLLHCLGVECVLQNDRLKSA